MDAERAGCLQAPVYDNAPVPAPGPGLAPAAAPTAGPADDCLRFKPGSSVVYYTDDCAAFLPIDILPKDRLEICWATEHLAFYIFPDKTQKQLAINLDNHQLMADVGQPKMMHIKTGGDWRLAM